MNKGRLIKPVDFVSMPWRNGLGTTIELIKQDLPGNSGFSWRLSMADVNENGPFSDFSGYDRTLVLLEGNGMDLDGDQGNHYVLDKPLDFAHFRGEDQIIATLHDGPIRDFNIMTSRAHCSARVSTSSETEPTHFDIEADIVLLYAVSENLIFNPEHLNESVIPAGHLLVIEDPETRPTSVQNGPFIAIQIINRF